VTDTGLCMCGHAHFKTCQRCYQPECPCRRLRPLLFDARSVIWRRQRDLIEGVRACPHSIREITASPGRRTMHHHGEATAP
jgi:hypothetical protein